MIGRGDVREALRVVRELAGVAPSLRYVPLRDSERISLGRMFESTARRHRENVFLICEGAEWTYGAFNARVNQLANLFQYQGVERGDTVALLMENRADYVLSMLALVKLGAAASLINHSLTGPALLHCLQATDARCCVFGEECLTAIDEIRDDLDYADRGCFFYFEDDGSSPAPDWAVDAGREMGVMPVTNLSVTRSIRAGEAALYIFTSGTTGLPKAAIIPHRKIVAAGRAIGHVGFKLRQQDRLYLCLPIYHMTGLGPGLCGFMSAGASIVLRRGFSASRFWPDIQEHQANCFVYVGELCRYLTMQEPCPDEEDNPLEKMLGNGLRPDVWDEFKARFNVDRICEIYGSSEGNVGFINLLNKDRTIGAALSPVAVVAYDEDIDAIVRDEEGRAITVPRGEPGLLLGKITELLQFDGYTDAEATERKIFRDVLRKGDRWFNTGDLVREVDVGFALGLKHFQFVDRTGDTFRWRAENVSTNEVAEVLNGHSQIAMANVYGVEVPGAEGRAGMVAFALEEGEELDLQELTALAERELPAYAQPVFVRVQRSLATTGTFKLLKGELREQAYHMDQLGDDEIYVRKPRGKGYERLDRRFYQKILDGVAGY